MIKTKQNLLHAVCVNCSNNFYVKDVYQLYGKRSPLLLHCGHSQCEVCIREALKTDNKVICKICEKESPCGTLNTLENLRNEFPLNLFLIGNMFLRVYKSKIGDDTISFKTKTVPLKKISVQNESCIECSKRASEVMCKQCGNTYCNACFDLVHCAARSLKLHEKIIIEKTSSAIKPSVIYCTSHKEQKIEFTCKTCNNLSVCSYCAIVDHFGHSVVQKQTENENKLEELTTLIEKSTQLQKRLKFSHKKADSLLRKPETADNKLLNLEKQVSSYFDHLHAMLQLKENALLDKLFKCRMQSMESLQNILHELDTSISELDSTLETARNATKPENLSHVNADEIIGKLTETLSKPCHLFLKKISKSDDESCDNEGDDLSFNITEDTLVDKIMSHCDITIKGDVKYVLAKEEDLPLDYVIEDVPVDVKSQVQTFAPLGVDVNQDVNIVGGASPAPSSEHSSRSSKINLNSVAENISFAKGKFQEKDAKPSLLKGHVKQLKRSEDFRVPSQKESGKHHREGESNNMFSLFMGLTAGTMETVRISHFNSPSDFYIHRKGSEVELGNLFLQCEKLHPQQKKPPEEATEGGLYLVRFDNDRKWYRGRVMSVMTIDKILVQYIDYGNREIVSIENLRNLLHRIAIIPPLAVHCKLFDCYPASGTEWSPEAIKMMAGIISGCDLTMYVMRTNEGSILEVDITKFNEDSPLSVREALLFHELATFIVTSSVAPKELVQKKNIFFSITNLKVGQTFDVNVTHINSPSDFFIRMFGRTKPVLSDISRQMNESYKRNPERDIVYSPSVGLPVAAFDFDGVWHRGQVTSLPGRRQVEVYLVDSGRTILLPWDNLRKLQNRFLRISAQAIRCALSDVIPPKRANSWSESAIKTFSQFVMRKRLKATVVDVNVEFLKIALYELHELKDTCINALFVQSGHADSVGITSTLAEFPKYSCNQPAPLTSSNYNKKPRPFQSVAELKCPVALKHDVPGSSLSHSLQSLSLASTADESASVASDSSTNGRIHIKVKKVIDPSVFYISFNIREQELSKLHEDMNAHYNALGSNKEIDCELKLEQIFAVLKEDESQWYRGIVKEVISENCVKVSLKDIAAELVVNKSNLRNLDDQFYAVADGTFLCHLAGVVAAGGQKWPGIATEVFQEQIDEAENKLYFFQKGDINRDDKIKSIPTELWIKRTVVGGPLEPSRHEWVSINRFLIDQGFALPDKSNPPTPAPSIGNSQSLANYTNPNLTATNESISEWMNKSNVGESTPSVSSTKRNLVEKKSPTKADQMELEESKLFKEWLPPQPFSETSFVGFPTYVDNCANIYIQELTSSDTLTIIQNALWSRFKDSKPMPHDLYWFPGQLCIAQYHVDKKWYRAKVLEVNADNSVTVEMVDYGNVEICKASELRKNICMTNIPLQCHKCSFKQLQPISEDGNWTTPVLDFMHASVVEKYCNVQIEGSVGSYNIITIKCPGGLDLSEILLNMNYARYILDVEDVEDNIEDENASVIIEDEVHDEGLATPRSISPVSIKASQDLQPCEPRLGAEVGLPPLDITLSETKMSWYDLVVIDERKISSRDYKDIELEEIEEFLADVTLILSPTSIVAQLYHENESSLADIKLNFIRLQDQLQEVAEMQPKMSDIEIGKPCISQYSMDDRWYRGLVVDVMQTENLVKVKYVDYGNIETVSKDSILEIKDEWMNVPQQGIKCRLHGVKLSDISEIKPCIEFLEKNILISPILLKIKRRTPILEVDLYKDGGSAVAYKELIDNKIFEEITDE